MKNKTSITEETFLNAIYKILDDNKALDITIINLGNGTSFADHMIIASGTSQRHLLALGDHLKIATHKAGQSYARIEGKENGTDWVLVDLGNIIVHLFRPEARQLYDLESMWDSPLLGLRHA